MHVVSSCLKEGGCILLHALTRKDGRGREGWEGKDEWRGVSSSSCALDDDDAAAILEEWRRWWVWVFLLSSYGRGSPSLMARERPGGRCAVCSMQYAVAVSYPSLQCFFSF